MASQQQPGSTPENGLPPLIFAVESVPCRVTACIDHFVPSKSEAEKIVSTFIRDAAPWLPIIALNSQTTYTSLRETKPLVTLSILMIGCRHDPPRQLAIGGKLRELTAYLTLVKNERSLEILQVRDPVLSLTTSLM